jgi:hypothetical protein
MLLTVRFFAAGLAPPAVALNDKLFGDTERAGAGGSTVSVTGISFGDPLTPADSTVTTAVYVPAASPAVLAVTLRSRGALPLAGVTESHPASSVAVKGRMPPPVLATFSVFAAGLAPPAVALKLSDDGATLNAGGCGALAGTPQR